MPDLGIFNPKCLIWVFLDHNFKITIVIFEISNPWICLIAKYSQIMKIPKFWDQKCLIWARILKNFCHIWNQHPQICLFVSFQEKTKLPKFGTKNAWFGYFWVGIWKKLLSYLKSAPLNLSKMSLYLIQWILVWGLVFLQAWGPLFLKVRVRVCFRFRKYAATNRGIYAA